MGQMTYGLAYGIPDNEFDSDVDLLEIYESDKKSEIETLAKESNSDYWFTKRQIIPERVYESSSGFIGFFLAVGASGQDGVPYLKEFRLDDVRDKYLTTVVETRWSAFAAWCSNKGIQLPDPSIWLVETEVA
jgi:hypothetical protein